MRDDASRARLTEMGFELYVPRGVRAYASAAQVRARVALIARDASMTGRSLLVQVARAFAFARVDAVVASDARDAGGADGLVVFGASLAREIGATMPAERRKSIMWTHAAEPGEIAGSVAAKRALWSELKRVARALAGA
jgi:hypothetical protein